MVRYILHAVGGKCLHLARAPQSHFWTWCQCTESVVQCRLPWWDLESNTVPTVFETKHRRRWHVPRLATYVVVTGWVPKIWVLGFWRLHGNYYWNWLNSISTRFFCISPQFFGVFWWFFSKFFGDYFKLSWQKAYWNFEKSSNVTKRWIFYKFVIKCQKDVLKYVRSHFNLQIMTAGHSDIVGC